MGRHTMPSASLASRASARKSSARRTHLLEVARSTGIAARHTMPSASLASRASARKSSARRTPHLIFFGGVQGCEKYHKGDDGKGCCKANTADCLACSDGKSVEKFCKKKKNRDVPGCEKKGCCKANTADCLACSKGKSVKRFCKKKRNRDVPGCEKYHRRGSLGEKD